MSDNLFDRQRAALANLSDAARARANSEAELTAAFQTATEKAEREVSRAREAHAAAREQEVGALDAEHAAAQERAAKEFTAELLANDRTRDDRRRLTTERFNAAQQRGQTEHKDKLWSFDSVLEAGEKTAKDQLDTLQRKAAAGREQVDALWAEAEPLLKRGRVTRAEVEFAGELSAPSDDDPISRMNEWLAAAEASVARLRGSLLPALGRLPGLLLFVALAAGLGAVALTFLPMPDALYVVAGTGVVLGFGLWLLVRSLGRASTLRQGKVVAEQLAEAARACQALNDYAATEFATEIKRLRDKHSRDRQKADEHYLPLLESQQKQFDAEVLRLETEFATAAERVRRKRGAESRAEDERHRTTREVIETRLGAELNAAEAAFEEKMSAATAARDAAWQSMASAWNATTNEVANTFGELRAAGESTFPAWDAFTPQRALADRVPAGIRFGALNVDLGAITDSVSTDERLAPPAALAGEVPAFLPFPDKCSVLLRCRDDGRAAGVTALQAMMLRFLTGLPPGKVRFTIIDPVGLGDNFAAFMHLADYDEKLVTSQIWTEPRDIEQRLADLTDHIASVIQKYLRNQYKSIEEYNRAAGEVAEPYRVLVVANFPNNFTPEAAKRLVSIANSGPSCGVCMLVTADTRAAMPRDFNLADLEAASYTLVWKDGRVHAEGRRRSPRSRWRWTRRRNPRPWPRSCSASARGARRRRASRCRSSTSRRSRRTIWHGSAAKGFEVPVGRAGRDAQAAVRARPRHGAARARRGQDRLRQVDAAARAHHQPGADVQPGRGGAVPHRLQGRRRVPVVRDVPAAARAGRRDPERARVRAERAPAARRHPARARREVPRRGRERPRRLPRREAGREDAAHPARRRRVPGVLHRRRQARPGSVAACSTGSSARAARSGCTSCSARRRSAGRTRSPAAPSTRWPCASRCSVPTPTRN